MSNDTYDPATGRVRLHDKDGYFISFQFEGEQNVEWRLRFNPESITRGDQLNICYMLETLHQLVFRDTQKVRNEKIQRIKKAIFKGNTGKALG